MKVFKVLCVDVLTHMQVIATDCSYNFACSYLESIGAQVEKTETDFRTNRTLIFSDKGLYVFDENRGMLLMD